MRKTAVSCFENRANKKNDAHTWACQRNRFVLGCMDHRHYEGYDHHHDMGLFMRLEHRVVRLPHVATSFPQQTLVARRILASVSLYLSL